MSTVRKEAGGFSLYVCACVCFQDECHNFIKVLVPRNDDLVFICGTNGFNPMCRYYRVSGPGRLQFFIWNLLSCTNLTNLCSRLDVPMFPLGLLWCVGDFCVSFSWITSSLTGKRSMVWRGARSTPSKPTWPSSLVRVEHTPAGAHM